MRVKIDRGFSIFGLFVHDSPLTAVDACWLEDQLNEEKLEYRSLDGWNFCCPECSGLSRFVLADNDTTLPSERLYNTHEVLDFFHRYNVQMLSALREMDKLELH